MAATNTPAANNPFRRMFMRGALGGATPGNTSGTNKSNPTSALAATGDPSLNQTFSGPAAGLAQFGQKLAQQRAGQAQQQQMSGALSELQQRLQEARDQGVNPAQAFLGILRDDPQAFMALHKSGILGDATALQQFVYGQQQAAQNAASAGKVTMVGPHTGYITDAKGGIHVLQLGQDEQYDANSGMIINKNTAVARPPIGPDGQPIPGKNATPAYKVKVNSDGSTTLETSGKGPPPSDVKAGPATGDDIFMQPHNMDDKQRAYLSNVTNLYGALKDLQTVGDQVMDPIQGKLKSFFGGQLFGTNDSAVMWNAAMARAENAIAKMPAGAGMGQTAVKEILGNLPKVWTSEHAGKVNLQGQIDDLQKEAQAMVNLSEVPQAGKNYPVAIDKGTANDLATMGVLSNRYRPGHGGDPKALGDDALQELVNHYGALQPDDQAAVKMEIQRRMTASAQQATTNLGTNQSNQGVNPNSPPQKPVQQPNAPQLSSGLPPISPQQPLGPGATGPLLTPQAPPIPAPYGQ